MKAYELKKYFCIVAATVGICAAILNAPLPVNAHGGGTDSYGCHNESATGTYHCHTSAPVACQNQTFSNQAAMLSSGCRTSTNTGGTTTGGTTGGTSGTTGGTTGGTSGTTGTGTTAALGGPAAATTLLFPHYAQGGGYQTLFNFNNTTSTAASVSLEFISPQGAPSGTASVLVPARGNGRYAMTGSSLTIGWVRATSSPAVDLLATETIQLFNGATLVMEASVLPAEQDLTVRMPITQRDGFSTGFAVMNPSSSSVTITATFIDANGITRGTSPITLGALGQQPKFVHEIFPANQDIDGTLELTASAAIAAVGLRMHASGIFSTLPVSTVATEVFFSPNAGTASRIVQEINRAQRTIDIAIYSFTLDEIADALVAAKARGISIRILADTSQANGTGSEIARLEGAGFQLKRTNGGAGGIMHHKYAIFDGRLLLTGSYNWSTNAEENSDENAVFTRSSALISAFQANFNAMWTR